MFRNGGTYGVAVFIFASLGWHGGRCWLPSARAFERSGEATLQLRFSQESFGNFSRIEVGKYFGANN